MDKDIIQFSHANGFPGSSYASLFQYLTEDFEIRYVDMFGHTDKFLVNNNWTFLVDELIDAIETTKEETKKKVIGVGHSLGAAITFFAAIKKPELFKALILLDVPIFTFPKTHIVQFLKKINRLYWVTPAGERTLQRKSQWPSYEKALHYFRTRPLFKNFSEKSLQNFVTYGTEETAIGRRLKFDPKVEAEIYKTLPDNYRNYCFQLKTPATAVFGQDSTITHYLDRRFMKKCFHMEIKKMQGGHLFPFEYPKETSLIIKESIVELLDKR